MNPFDPRAPRAAFQPPSDMSGGEGGSSATKKVFIGLGIGCGVILIVLGILFAAGAFKAVTCCNEVKNIADTSVGAEAFGGQFAQQLYGGELEAAYAATSDEFQGEMSLDAFKSAVEAHRDRLSANQPRLFNMQLEQHGDQKPSLEGLSKGTWLMSYQFAGPNDDTMLLLTFRVARAGEGEEAGFEARDVKFDERPRNLQHEPPAEEVLQVHDMIQRGQYELAYARLGDDFRSTSDREAWRAFLKDTGDVLTSSTLEIRQVSYNESNTQATVMAHAKPASGEDAIVQFELQPMRAELPGFGWRIVAIAPIIAESPEAAEAADPMNTGTQTNAGSATNQAATNGAAAPTVEEVDVK